MKAEERFELIIDDSQFETNEVDIVDQAFASQVCMLNLWGIGKPERSCKVDRLQEILEQVLLRQPEPVNEEGSETNEEEIN